MPSTTQGLRDKFMGNGDDGIGKAENTILKYGGTVNIPSIGMIKVPPYMDKETPADEDTKTYNEFWDAVQFLIEEWDYAIL